MEWLFVESNHLQDIGCQNLVLGDVIPATMRGAVATTTVHLSIPQKCIVEISGRVREERFGRLICDLEDHGTMPVEVRQPSGKSPGASLRESVFFVLMWGYEAEIFSPEIPTQDFLVQEIGAREDSHRMDGCWTGVEALADRPN